MLTCNQLVKTYQRKNVVNALSFHVNKGEVFALLGSNGAGKTTTIKMILGLVKKDAGTVEGIQSMQVGYSPETPYFPPFLTGKEVLMYYAKIQKMKKSECAKIVEELLERVGLEDDKKKIKHYSKGMLQRLALAQALIGDHKLLILDEPTAGLDSLGRLEMLNLIKKLQEEGKTIVLNSHILNDIEKVCNRGIIMKKGSVVREWSQQQEQGKTLEEVFLEAVGGIQ